MDIVVLEIGEDDDGYFVQGIVKDTIQPISLEGVCYKTPEAKTALMNAFQKAKSDTFSFGFLRHLNFKKRDAENLVKTLVRNDVLYINHGKEFVFAGIG